MLEAYIKYLNSLTVPELEHELKQGELLKTDLTNDLSKMKTIAKDTFLYESEEKAHHGMINFYGNKIKTEEKFHNLNKLINQFGQFKNNENISAVHTQQTNNILENAYQAGENYAKIFFMLQKLENVMLPAINLVISQKN